MIMCQFIGREVDLSDLKAEGKSRLWRETKNWSQNPSLSLFLGPTVSPLGLHALCFSPDTSFLCRSLFFPASLSPAPWQAITWALCIWFLGEIFHLGQCRSSVHSVVVSDWGPALWQQEENIISIFSASRGGTFWIKNWDMYSVDGTAALTLRMEELWKMAGIILLPYLPRTTIIYDP